MNYRGAIQLRAHLAPLTRHDTIESLFEPGDGVLLVDLVLDADAARLVLAALHTAAGAGEADVEVHTVDTGGGIVLDAEVNVLLDTETEVTCERRCKKEMRSEHTNTDGSSAGRTAFLRHSRPRFANRQRPPQASFPTTKKGRIPAREDSHATMASQHAGGPSTQRSILCTQGKHSKSSPQHSKQKRAVLGEVLVLELELADLEAALDDLESLGTANGDVGGDLLVTADTEGAEGVAGLGQEGFLTRDLLQHTGGLGELVTGSTAGDVQHELVDLHGTHDVAGILGLVGHLGHLGEEETKG